MLLLQLVSARQISVGRLGEVLLQPGWYLYVGSAFGPGGVKARCGHHRQISSRPRWHIDYLRAVADLREIWFSHDSQRREHQWTGLLGRLRGASFPLSGFGSSDCDCDSHLLFFSSIPSFNGFRRRAYRDSDSPGGIWREIV